MRDFLRFFTLLIAMTLAGCGAAIPTIKPYKMDIQQGNVVTSEMLLKLRPGMTKSQVQFIMGTPLLVDSFHTNRWDYFYQLRKQGEVVTQRRVILDFEKDLLVRVRGDVVPKGATVEDVTQQLETEAGKKEQSTEQTNEPIKETDAPVEPIVKPIDPPDVEPVEPAAEPARDDQAPADTSESTESSTPASVLAVPIPVQPSQTTDLAPKGDMQAEDVSTAKDAKMEASAIEPVDASQEAAAPAAVEKEALTSSDVQKSSPVLVPAATEEGVEEAKKSTSTRSNPNDKMVFRLDRQLDASRISQEIATPKAPSQNSVVQEINDESQEEVSPDQGESGVFERILERIGF